MSNIVSPLNNRFPLADGFRPANSGTLYIGKAGTDPTVVINQLTVTGRKSDGTTVALTQPINLNNLGQPLDGNGNTIDLLVDSHYSFAAFDAYGKLQTSISTQIIIEVDGFASLRTLPVIYEGQRVTLLGWDKGTNVGGGVFVGHKGNKTDDGGHIASGSGYYWERITDCVKLTDFGIKVSSRESGKEAYYDCTDAIQAATRRAIEKGWDLVSDFNFAGDPGRDGYPRWGYLISKTWDITGLKNLRGQFNILCRGSVLAQTGTVPLGGTTAYCITALNCNWGSNGKIYGTSYGNMIIEKLILFNLDGYSSDVALNGILTIASGSRFEFMMANGFNGKAIHFADCYDNIMGDIRVLYSGNENNFALDVSSWKADTTSKADESNANTFMGVMAHNCREKSWRIAGTKQNVIRIHDEALLSKVSAPSEANGIEKRNGYGYTSCYFSSIGGHLGVVSFSTFDSASTVIPVLTFGGAVSCSCDNIASGITGAAVSIVAGDPGPSGGSFISSITCKEFKTNASANTTIGSIRAGTMTLVDPRSPILSGQCTGDLTVLSSAAWTTLKDMTVGGIANINTAGLFNNMTFNGPVVINADTYSTITNRMRHVFEHCKFNSSISSTTSRVLMRECGLNSGEPFVITGGGEGVRIEYCRLNMPITLSGGSTLDLYSVDPSGTTITATGTGTINISNCNWSTGVITATSSGQVIIRDNSIVGTITGFLNARIIDSEIVNSFTVGTNARYYISGSKVGTVIIDGTSINFDATKTFFNVLNFVAGATGIWRFDTNCLAWASANWITPTVVSGYGVRTYDMSTSTVYKVVSGAWVKISETTA